MDKNDKSETEIPISIPEEKIKEIKEEQNRFNLDEYLRKDPDIVKAKESFLDKKEIFYMKYSMDKKPVELYEDCKLLKKSSIDIDKKTKENIIIFNNTKIKKNVFNMNKKLYNDDTYDKIFHISVEEIQYRNLYIKKITELIITKGHSEAFRFYNSICIMKNIFIDKILELYAKELKTSVEKIHYKIILNLKKILMEYSVALLEKATCNNLNYIEFKKNDFILTRRDYRNYIFLDINFYIYNPSSPNKICRELIIAYATEEFVKHKRLVKMCINQLKVFDIEHNFDQLIAEKYDNKNIADLTQAFIDTLSSHIISIN